MGWKKHLIWMDIEDLKIASVNMYKKIWDRVLAENRLTRWDSCILLPFSLFFIQPLIVLWMLMRRNIGRYFNTHETFGNTCASMLAGSRIKLMFRSLFNNIKSKPSCEKLLFPKCLQNLSGSSSSVTTYYFNSSSFFLDSCDYLRNLLLL